MRPTRGTQGLTRVTIRPTHDHGEAWDSDEVPWPWHCVDLAKVEVQQGRLLFLISSVKPVPKRRSMTVQPVSERRYMTVKQPSWQEITRHRLGKGANLKKLKNLKLNFEFGSEISPPKRYCNAMQPRIESRKPHSHSSLPNSTHDNRYLRTT